MNERNVRRRRYRWERALCCWTHNRSRTCLLPCAVNGAVDAAATPMPQSCWNFQCNGILTDPALAAPAAGQSSHQSPQHCRPRSPPNSLAPSSKTRENDDSRLTIAKPTAHGCLNASCLPSLPPCRPPVQRRTPPPCFVSLFIYLYSLLYLLARAREHPPAKTSRSTSPSAPASVILNSAVADASSFSVPPNAEGKKRKREKFALGNNWVKEEVVGSRSWKRGKTLDSGQSVWCFLRLRSADMAAAHARALILPYCPPPVRVRTQSFLALPWSLVVHEKRDIHNSCLRVPNGYIF